MNLRKVVSNDFHWVGLTHERITFNDSSEL
jgi:hypothetical protein